MQLLQPLLFIYAGIVFLNTSLSLFLWRSYKKDLFKYLFFFWSSVFLSFILQGAFQKGTLPIVLAQCTFFLPIMIIVKMLYAGLNQHPSFKNYYLSYGVAGVLTVALGALGMPFLWVALPGTLALAYVLFDTSLKTLRRPAGPVAKIYAVTLFLNGLHFLDYPYLRPNPDMAVAGFSLALLFVVAYSILLPIFVVQKVDEDYAAELEKEVENRTVQHLTLLNIVCHDISTPIQIVTVGADQLHYQLKKLGAITPNIEEVSKKIENASVSISETLAHVKEMQANRLGKKTLDISPVDIEEVINELIPIYQEKLDHKGVRLIIENLLQPGSKIMADRRTLKNQVLTNFLSNAIKFSFPNSSIVMRLEEVKGRVQVQIIDRGKGIPPEYRNNIFLFNKPSQQLGTSGEKGTGFGMPIAKTYLDLYGAEISMESKTDGEAGDNHGTQFNIAFKKAG